jgi:hypothetical protein
MHRCSALISWTGWHKIHSVSQRLSFAIVFMALVTTGVTVALLVLARKNRGITMAKTKAERRASKAELATGKAEAWGAGEQRYSDL